MRSDERDCQNQILQVLSVAATAMSILFGGGLLFGKPEDKNAPLISDLSDMKGFSQTVANYCTQARLVFLITSIILCVAITYTLKLCIGNMLRYCHTKELQNRIQIYCGNLRNIFPGVIKTTYILEFLMLMVMIVVCYYLKNQCLEVGCILTIIISIIKAVAAVYMVMSMVLNHFVPVKDLRILICVFFFQLLIQITYYFLRYEPRPISIRDVIFLLIKKLGIVVFTEKVVNKLVGKGKNDC